jgi:hypothetical protein
MFFWTVGSQMAIGVVSLMCQLLFTPRKIPGAQGHSSAGGIKPIEKSTDAVGMECVTFQLVA